jgi:hypothetical protein
MLSLEGHPSQVRGGGWTCSNALCMYLGIEFLNVNTFCIFNSRRSARLKNPGSKRHLTTKDQIRKRKKKEKKGFLEISSPSVYTSTLQISAVPIP